MGDIRDSVLRIQKYLEVVRKISGLEINDGKSILDKLKNPHAGQGGAKERLNSIAKKFPALNELINDLISDYGATTRALDILRRAVEGKLTDEGLEREETALTELDEEFVGMDRLEIHEYSTLADKDLFKTFLANYDEYRNMFEKISESKDLGGAFEHIIDGRSEIEIWYDCLENWLQLKPALILTGKAIPNNIRDIYAESRRCFLFGNYLAAIVLSRAVLENILKNKFDLKNNWSAGELLQKLHVNKQITDSQYDLAKSVKDKADKILHRAAGATTKEAKNAIDRTNELIEMFYGLPEERPKGKMSSN
jgi:hypothetical protein